MNQAKKTVSDAELAVLKVLWRRGSLNAREITREIYPSGTDAEFASVHSFLQRLEKKQLVCRDRSGYVHSFTPAVSREDLAGQELQSLAQRLGEESLVPLLLHLMREQRLSPEEAAEIRSLLDERTSLRKRKR